VLERIELIYRRLQKSFQELHGISIDNEPTDPNLMQAGGEITALPVDSTPLKMRTFGDLLDFDFGIIGASNEFSS
jgi:hypothetical protein